LRMLGKLNRHHVDDVIKPLEVVIRLQFLVRGKTS
jgi:hypothetical protein